MALFHPEIASESNFNFDLESHLVLNSTAAASVANKSSLVLAQSVLVLVVYKSAVCISLGTNLFILTSIEPLNNITILFNLGRL